MRQQTGGRASRSPKSFPNLSAQLCTGSPIPSFQNVRKTSQVKKMSVPRIEDQSLFSQVSDILREYQPSSYDPFQANSNTGQLPVIFKGLSGSKTYTMGAINSIAMHGNLIYNLLQNPERENRKSKDTTKRPLFPEKKLMFEKYFSQLNEGKIEDMNGEKEEKMCGCKKVKCVKNRSGCQKLGNKCVKGCLCNECRNQ